MNTILIGSIKAVGVFLSLLIIFGLAACKSMSNSGVVKENVDVDKIQVFGFSQSNVDEEEDNQVFDFKPDMNIRAWQKWKVTGTRVEDFNVAAVERYHNEGVLFIGGGTASILFREEASSEEEFLDWVTVDAFGDPVPHNYIVSGAFRASLASESYRKYLVDLMKLQIDAGVDGIFLDEVNGGGYSGGDKWRFNGNEGFDKYFLSDFTEYLLEKYPSFSGEDWGNTFSMSDRNYPKADIPTSDLDNNFNYRTYLQEHGWLEDPMTEDNPLLLEWGVVTPNRVLPNASSFREVAVNRYWKKIVDALRYYALHKYSREILITSNGIFPYTDFNSLGMYNYNSDDYDGTGPYVFGKEANYVPVKSQHLDGAFSLQPIFQKLYNLNKQIAGDVPLVLFLDWPTAMISDYSSLPLPERIDFWRIYMAEAYAHGLKYTFHLKTSIPDDPTANSLDMLPFFKEYATFYRKNSSVFDDVVLVDHSMESNTNGIMMSMTKEKRSSLSYIHLVNHNYEGEILPQRDISIESEITERISSITLVSPDVTSKESLVFTQVDNQLEIQVPELKYSAVLILEH